MIARRPRPMGRWSDETYSVARVIGGVLFLVTMGAVAALALRFAFGTVTP